MCPDEPEATVQPRKDGVMRPSYKPSILADKNRLIVGQHVDPNSEMASVVPMLEQYRGVFDSLPMTSLWDGNYNTFEMLELSISTDMNVLLLYIDFLSPLVNFAVNFYNEPRNP